VNSQDFSYIPFSTLPPVIARRNAGFPSEDLREMAWAGVADFEPDLDQAARTFADQLLGARDALAGHKLQRSHAGGLLEDMGNM
jgi:hypothetical protein